MALDDIQTIDRDLSVKKEDKDKTIYSINLKQSTLEKVKALMAKRDELMANLQESVAQDVNSGSTMEQLVGKNIVLAAKIAELEKKINILSLMQGPIEARGQRAIRLIKKMYDETINKSNLIYPATEKQEETFSNNNVSVPETSPIVEVPPVVDVQQIAESNEKVIGQTIENAITAEKTLDEKDIKEVTDASLGVVVPPVVTEVATTPVVVNPVVANPVVTNPVVTNPIVTNTINENLNTVPVTSAPVMVEVSTPVQTVPVVVATEPEVNLDELNRINNETLRNYAYDSMNINSVESEYVPMTDEEVLKSQKKLEDDEIRSEEARHQRILEEEARKEKEVAEINESKGFEFESIPTIVNLPNISVEEKEYAPMTEEEVLESQKKLEETEIKSEEAKQQRLVEEGKIKENDESELEEFNFESVPTVVNISSEVEKPLRDETIIVPERPEPVEEKVLDEPRMTNVNDWEKEKLIAHRDDSIVEMAELLKAEKEREMATIKAQEKSEAELNDIKEDYARLIENEAAAEKNLADLEKEEEMKSDKINRLCEDMRKQLIDLQKKNADTDDAIKKNQEEFSSIKEDGDRRNERLESLTKEADAKKERIAQLDDMLRKYGPVEEDTTIYAR